MGTIAGSPRPSGPIGYVTVNGQRLPVEADPVWWRHWTEQFDASRALLDGSITTEKGRPGMATAVYASIDVPIAAAYGFGRRVVMAVAIPPQPVAVRLCVSAVFDASGPASFEAEKLASLFVTTADNIEAPAPADFVGGRFVSASDPIYQQVAKVASTRTKCSLTAPFDIQPGIAYVAGVQTVNQIPFSSGLTFYDVGTVEAQAIRL